MQKKKWRRRTIQTVHQKKSKVAPNLKKGKDRRPLMEGPVEARLEVGDPVRAKKEGQDREIVKEDHVRDRGVATEDPDHVLVIAEEDRATGAVVVVADHRAVFDDEGIVVVELLP